MAERFLVTGACGFQGSHMVDLLVARGEDVVATDLPGSDTSYVDRAGVPFVAADITRPGTLERVFAQGPFDGVFHFAELVSYSAPADLLAKVNVEGTAHLMDAMHATGAERLLAVSSGGVYGKPVRIPADERLSPEPITRYDHSKAAMERTVWEKANALDIQATILRPAAVYGPRSRKGAAIPLFLLALGQMPAVPGRGDVYSAFAHVADVVAAARHLITFPPAVGEVYNVADDTLLTFEDVLFMLAPHVDAHVARIHLPMWGLRLLSWWNRRRAERTGRPPKIERDALELIMHDTFMSNRKLKDTGYVLQYPDYVVGMVETIEWYKAHNWLWRDDQFKGRMELLGGPA